MGIERRFEDVTVKDRIKGVALIIFGIGVMYGGALIEKQLSEYTPVVEPSNRTEYLNQTHVITKKEILGRMNATGDSAVDIIVDAIPYAVLASGAGMIILGAGYATNLKYRRRL